MNFLSCETLMTAPPKARSISRATGPESGERFRVGLVEDEHVGALERHRGQQQLGALAA